MVSLNVFCNDILVNIHNNYYCTKYAFITVIKLKYAIINLNEIGHFNLASHYALEKFSYICCVKYYMSRLVVVIYSDYFLCFVGNHLLVTSQNKKQEFFYIKAFHTSH